MPTMEQALKYFALIATVCECVSNALADNVGIGTLGRPGRVVCLVPGNEVPWDGCECGQLAFAVQHGPYPSTIFPAENLDNVEQSNCVLGSSAIRVVASLIRCRYHPAMSPDGTPPTPEQQLAASMLQQIEGFIIRDTLYCCLADMKRDRRMDSYALGSTDYQVNGDCGEVSTVFYLGLS